jgi:NAD(P)-dependent dehydrogenase (short-subunit alcohol dehydrogenase family)
MAKRNQPDLSVRGLKVVVTAGAAGIGRAIAETFADAGAQVHVCDVAKDALAALKKARPDITGHLADVSDPKAIARFFAKATKGGLDILVNNAGIAGPTAPIDEIKAEDWVATIDINLNSMFYFTKLAVPLLKKKGGSIINLSSVAGRLGFPLRTPYAATKWAVVGLTKSLAMELGPHKIRVNAIQPGMVAGPRIDRVISARAQASGTSFEQQREISLSKISMRTQVSADDIAAMALFLASPAGARISGQALSVCGNVETLA